MIINSIKASNIDLLSAVQKRSVTGGSDKREVIDYLQKADHSVLNDSDNYSTYNIALGRWHANIANLSQKSEKTNEPNIFTMDHGKIAHTLDRVQKQAQSVDYSGMSDTEIYQTITARYTQAFGDDFMRESNAFFQPNKAYNDVVKAYNNELSQQFGSTSQIYAVARQATYGNMTFEEITKAIKSKYPPLAEQTFGETMAMCGELMRSGADDYQLRFLVHNTANMLSSMYDNSKFAPQSIEAKLAFGEWLLDQKLDPGAMAFYLDSKKFAGQSISDEVYSMMRDSFGMSCGANGRYDSGFDFEEWIKSYLQHLNDKAPMEDAFDDWFIAH
ncbi:hypothetical protein DesLBE_3295 [Desulfitobacterium sp. LBE]|uniref:hypothetical protein n=1 Tax=Desulfitobacterium sp. LBE TaxID=884086 RepID=UPI00119C47BC|nr:hypothetical protein [Desulfitobacterium sp. LBE]TWH58937.1 hypothetical protein DesLBE_3295 [Desulfitobacterium sp. LBE]